MAASCGRRSLRPDRSDSAHYKNGYASATPATDGERVYVSFGSRGLFAFDLDGKLLWQRDLGRISNYHGPAGSPLLYKDRVILYQDHDAGGFIAAFNAQTGQQIWRTARQASVGWGTPIAVRVGDHDEIIVNGQSRVVAYDPTSGRELWRCGGSSYEVIPTPVVGYGLVFCASGRVGPTLAIRPGGQGDVTNSHLAWSTPRGSPFVPSPILYGEHLYTVNDMASIVTVVRGDVGTRAVAGPAGRGAARGIFGVTGCGRRQGLLHERRGRDVRAAGRSDVSVDARQRHRRAHARLAGAGRRPLVHQDRSASCSRLVRTDEFTAGRAENFI